MKAVIFDLDGTLIDSMYVWAKADREFLSRFSIVPDDEYNRVISTLTFTEGVSYIKNRYNINMSLEDIKKELYNLAYNEYAYNIGLKSGVMEFLKGLRENNIKMGIATSCISDMCFSVLKRIGIYDYFDAIVFSEDIGVNKNFPDIYVETARRMGENIENCIVFEDVPHAVIGAKKSGAYVVGVYDEFSKDKKEEMLNICDRYIYSFDEISL
ncbi:MAG: HAD family phosphatase [Tyzzerella sp.]|uniref:HAD family phosphatase n=1 Tax=Candidatus Fimicola merdigallinarum TaxID=2840819 RepID=A0A9D9DZS8_9FIRM|nr:HAD family phosphatase [Candidatus Fimicola merdigallinarum]